MYLPTSQELRDRRKAFDLTQAELADAAGVSQPLIARIEGGDVDPRLSTLRRIVDALEEAEGNVVRAREVMNEDVVSIELDDSVNHANEIMQEEGYSQLPVIRNHEFVGVISISDVRKSRSDDASGDLSVGEIMDASTSTVETDARLERIDSLLDIFSTVLVKENDEVVGIITEADVAAHVS